MINRGSLSVKILLLAFLNVLLLGVVFFAIVRVQLRLDLGSFLLAPARDRILSVSRLIGLQLPVVPMTAWDQLLEQSSKQYPVEFYLFDVNAHQLAGKPVELPEGCLDSIRRGRLHL